MWKCKKCKREFHHKNQWHSCVKISVWGHFKSSPKLRRVFSKLVRELKKETNVKIDAVRTGINFANKGHFAMAFVRRDRLKIDFLLDRALKDKRIRKIRRIGSKFINYAELGDEKDVDKKFISWLKEAYAQKSI